MTSPQIWIFLTFVKRISICEQTIRPTTNYFPVEIVVIFPCKTNEPADALEPEPCWHLCFACGISGRMKFHLTAKRSSAVQPVKFQGPPRPKPTWAGVQCWGVSWTECIKEATCLFVLDAPCLYEGSASLQHRLVLHPKGHRTVKSSPLSERRMPVSGTNWPKQQRLRDKSFASVFICLACQISRHNFTSESNKVNELSVLVWIAWKYSSRFPSISGWTSVEFVGTRTDVIDLWPSQQETLELFSNLVSLYNKKASHALTRKNPSHVSVHSCSVEKRTPPPDKINHQNLNWESRAASGLHQSKVSVSVYNLLQLVSSHRSACCSKTPQEDNGAFYVLRGQNCKINSQLLDGANLAGFKFNEKWTCKLQSEYQQHTMGPIDSVFISPKTKHRLCRGRSCPPRCVLRQICCSNKTLCVRNHCWNWKNLFSGTQGQQPDNVLKNVVRPFCEILKRWTRTEGMMTLSQDTSLRTFRQPSHSFQLFNSEERPRRRIAFFWPCRRQTFRCDS